METELRDVPDDELLELTLVVQGLFLSVKEHYAIFPIITCPIQIIEKYW